jgi:acyl-CoA thioester hydrolase
MERPPSPPLGRLEPGGVHVFPVRVYYEDTDCGGIVYHASYLRFAERARTEMLRCAGVTHSRMIDETGRAFAVRRMEIDYVAPARLDDALEVWTRIDDIGGATLDAEQVVRRQAAPASPTGVTGGDELVRIRLRLACINQKGRPARLPSAVRAALLAAAEGPAGTRGDRSVQSSDGDDGDGRHSA